jgi:hypothetical protein
VHRCRPGHKQAVAFPHLKVRSDTQNTDMIPGMRYVRDVLNGGPLIKNRAAMLPGRRVGTVDEVAQVILMLMTQ